MDIAYLSPYVYPFVKGGVQKRIHEVGSRLVERGHGVTVYSRNSWEWTEEYEHQGMVLRSIGPTEDLYVDGDRRSISKALEFAGRSVLPLVRHVDDHDIVSMPVAPYLHVFPGWITSGFRRTPLVITWHEVWREYWHEYLGLGGSVGKFIETVIANLPHHPVAPSTTTADRLRAITRADREIAVIPNGIDMETVQTTQPAEPGFDILYAGRLIEDKNVDLLLEAFDRTDTDATLGIVGGGPAYDTLTRQARRLKSADRVTFLGFLENSADVLSHMKAADVFVSPSIREGFGITLVEALAADCTVITVNHPNSAGSEIVANAGFVTAPAVSGIADAIERALSGVRPPCEPVARAAEFDWDEVAAQTEQHFTSIVST